MQISLIDAFVVFALLGLCLGLAVLAAYINPLITQGVRTLESYAKLADTLEEELAPTLREVQKVVVGVGELRQIAGQTMSGVGTKVEDVTGNITKVAGNAQRSSSVWGAGLLAGAKAYLEGKGHEHRDTENGRQSSSRRHVIDRGEENVGLKR